jgi:lysyl-tRNA synthetase class 2
MTESRQAQIRPNLILRARILSAIRLFFAQQGFLEVETPIRIPVPAPEAHIDPQAADGWVLQTSPELCMKRLLAAGYERIFQICHCFRKKERGSRHLPEMTLLEWYRAGWTYEQMMDHTEALLRFVAEHLKSPNPLPYQGLDIDLTGAWERITVAQAFARYTPLSMNQALGSGRFDEVMGLDIEPHLGLSHPVFLYDYPAEKGALARLKKNDKALAERFELYIGGIELCNAFSELTDAAEQRRRFEDEAAKIRLAGKEGYDLPEKFLKSLADMPDAAGNALGLDRLVMLLSNARQIDEVVAFTSEEL